MKRKLEEMKFCSISTNSAFVQKFSDNNLDADFYLLQMNEFCDLNVFYFKNVYFHLIPNDVFKKCLCHKS